MYSNDQELHWSNVTLMTYKDTSYGTDGFLRLSLSTNTPDYKNFNQPKLNLMISNNFSKTCSLDVVNSVDIAEAADNALKSLKVNGDFSGVEIKRVIKRNLQLIMAIFMDKNKNIPLVKVEINSNESDFTRTIMPLQYEFISIIRIMKRFNEDYINICSNLLSQAATSQILNLPELIKGLPSGIVSKIPAPDEAPPSEETIKGAAETEITMDNFEKYAEMNIDSVKVPELEKASDEHVTEIDSKFVKDVLKNDLSLFESMLNNEALSPNPISLLSKKFSELFEMETPSLPGIAEKEVKSLHYLSKLYYSLVHQDYVNNGAALPHATPVFKYKAKEFKDENIELAYDLLLFSLYIRGVRRRLEGKENDAIKNCALFHLQLRYYVDPFIFSFIDNITPDKLSTVLVQRYKYYKKQNVFATYEQKLQDYNCPELTENDILTMVVELSDKVIGKAKFICDLHDGSAEANSLRLPSENNFTLEQITNEIIPLEVAEKMGKDINDESVIEQIKQSSKISDEILNFFKESKKKVKVDKKSDAPKVSNIERAIMFHKEDIPEKYRQPFIEFMKEFAEKKFNFITTFPLEEFGQNIIRALYIWDPEDPKLSKNYKNLLKQIEI